MAEGAGQNVMGYILGKVEGEDENWHGHVTALTVAPDFRYTQVSFGLAGTTDSKIMCTMSMDNNANHAALLDSIRWFSIFLLYKCDAPMLMSGGKVSHGT